MIYINYNKAQKITATIIISILLLQSSIEINYGGEILIIRENKKVKIAVISKVSIDDKDDLSVAYTPDVAAPCQKIQQINLKSIDIL